MRQQVTNEEKRYFFSTVFNFFKETHCQKILQIPNIQMSLNSSNTNSGKKKSLRSLIKSMFLNILHITGSGESEELSLFFLSFAGHSGRLFWLDCLILNGFSYALKSCANKYTYKSVLCSIHQSALLHILSFCKDFLVGRLWFCWQYC